MNTWLLILGMLAITFVIRYSFFAWPDLRFPRAIERGLHYVPECVLGPDGALRADRRGQRGGGYGPGPVGPG